MTWIYIQTSISEGLPVSVIEAGLTGKCVVCTNVGGCAELLANPNVGGWACRGLPDGPERVAMFQGQVGQPANANGGLAALHAHGSLQSWGSRPTACRVVDAAMRLPLPRLQAPTAACLAWTALSPPCSAASWRPRCEPARASLAATRLARQRCRARD